MIVLRDQDRRRLARDGVEQLLRRLDVALPVAVAPSVAAQPAPRRDLGLAHAGERLLDRRAAVQLHLALGQRPGREVDVGVGERGEDAAAAEVHHVGACERGLVDADAAGDVGAGDRERPSGRQRGVERADDAVLEDHGAEPRWSLPRGRPSRDVSWQLWGAGISCRAHRRPELRSGSAGRPGPLSRTGSGPDTPDHVPSARDRGSDHLARTETFHSRF